MMMTTRGESNTEEDARGLWLDKVPPGALRKNERILIVEYGRDDEDGDDDAMNERMNE